MLSQWRIWCKLASHEDVNFVPVPNWDESRAANKFPDLRAARQKEIERHHRQMLTIYMAFANKIVHARWLLMLLLYGHVEPSHNDLIRNTGISQPPQHSYEDGFIFKKNYSFILRLEALGFTTLVGRGQECCMSLGWASQGNTNV